MSDQDFRAALAKLDFKAMADAWIEADTTWHAGEWQAFILAERRKGAEAACLYLAEHISAFGAAIRTTDEKQMSPFLVQAVAAAMNASHPLKPL